jgi:FAD/FMN-containing dehydrogenase
MTRKSFLKRLAALPVLSAIWRYLPAQASDVSPTPPVTRVRPADAAWPDAASWEKLNQMVGGRLLKVESPLAACRNGTDPEACEKVIKDLRNPFYVGDQPGATQSTGWVDAWISAPSVYAVAAETTDDVVAAVNFARVNNLRLVVKGGGHSYQGTSNAPDSLLIWTRAMNKIVLQDAFVGQGCDKSQAPQPAVTIEAGAMWIDAYLAVTTEAGRYVQGGGCTSVGVAGLIQSGGFGSFSKRFGTAAAGLLEAEIVTAEGAVRIANACTNPDLFWAIKGGGGGSLGVVTKVTLRTRELPEFFGAASMTIEASSDAAFRQLISRFFAFYSNSLFNPHWSEMVALGPDNNLVISMVSQGLTQEQIDAIWNPFLYEIKNSGQQFTVKRGPLVKSFPARLMWDPAFFRKYAPSAIFSDTAPRNRFWWSHDNAQVGAYWHGFDSVWLPETLLAEEQQEVLADALYSASRHWSFEIQFSKGLAGAPPEEIAAARDTATNPAVLTAFALVTTGGYGPPVYPGLPGHEPDLMLARRSAGKIAQAMNELKKVVPEAGSYVSESNYFNESWQEAFWGPNYPRLRAIKKKYDPIGLFFVHHGVGSEEWSTDGFTRKT